MAVKVISEDLPVFEIAFVPSVVCFLATSALLFVTKTSVVASDSFSQALTLLRAALGAASLTLYYVSIEQLALKDAVTLFFCSPVIAAVLEWCIRGDNINAGSMFGCLSTVLGVFLVTQPDCVHHIVNMGSPHAMGMVVAGAAATANAGAFVVVRLLQNSQSALALTWWYHMVVMIATFFPLLISYPSAPVMPSTRDGLLLAAIAACQFIGQLLLNRGFMIMTATRGSAINVLQVMGHGSFPSGA